MDSLTHLCTRSYYSLLDGTMSVEELVGLAKENGMKSLALSERHVLYSALEFQLECDKQGIKAIFGLEITIRDHEDEFDSLVLAKNQKGYEGLISFSKLLLDQGYIEYKDLDPFQDNLVFIVYSEKGPFEKLIIQESFNQIKEVFTDLKSKYKHFYLGVSHQESEFFKKNNHRLLEVADELEIPSLALSKVYYKKKEDASILRILHAIKNTTYYDDKTLVSAPNRQFYTPAEMKNLYRDDLIENIQEVVDLCNLDLKTLKTNLPVFKNHHKATSSVYLEELSRFGLQRRLKNEVTQTYWDRLKYELEVITSMNFSDYFLIVYDVIRFAKKEGIYVGPGRGSSAGSLVAYSLGITEVDPIEYGLYFERFLNPSRKEMPDIDIDFPDDKRDLVIEYMRETYGDEHVAHIVTYGTMKARQAFRDVARVFQIPVRNVDRLSKLIPSQSLEESFEMSVKFRQALERNKQYMDVFNYAKKIQGLPRHTSLHAAGIVLSDRELKDFIPYFNSGEVGSVIQYDMSHLESIGLIKIDFLGLRNLSIIDNIRRDIPGLNINSIPLNDEKALALLSRGETLGLFQLESDGMTNLLKQMKPRRFMDLVDALALYRPGPMENIPLYLKNRENPDQVEYLHEDLKQITEKSYGILIYQEQIMQVAQIMAGFSLAKADIMRKAMSQKDGGQLSKLKEEFVSGTVGRGYSLELANEIFALILRFADYGFNKSHSVAYARIAYQMTYLKAHYPLLFYRYLLNSVKGSVTRTNLYLNECRRRNLKIVHPSMNRSGDSYNLFNDELILPLTLVKGISANISNVIEEERKTKGDFIGYYDAISRLSLKKLARHHFIALIHGGAFDEFKDSRQAMKNNLEEALTYASLITIVKDEQYQLNTDLVSVPRFKDEKDNMHERLSEEKDVLGFYLSEHPTLNLQRKHQTPFLKDVEKGYKKYKVIVMIDHIKEHKTKKGDLMAFTKVSDDSMELDAIVFPRLYAEVQEQLELGAIVYIKGNMKEEGKIILEDLYRFDL